MGGGEGEDLVAGRIGARQLGDYAEFRLGDCRYSTR